MTVATFQKRLVGLNGQRIVWSHKDILRIAAYFGVDASKATLPEPPAPARRAPDEHSMKDASSDGITAHFIASDGSVDRMGDTIDPNGWRLSAFKKNPVILYGHDSGSLPVGRATSVGVQSGKLMVGVKFASTGIGRSIAGLVHKGFLNAVSVGFAPISYDFAKTPGRAGGIDFKSQELLEVSIVPIPANANALLVGIAEGNKGFNAIKLKEQSRRERELELLKLRAKPLTAREARELEVARMRSWR